MSHPNPRPFVIVLCGFMLALNAISCDMLLPGLFAIQGDLRVPIAQVQAIVPLFLMSAAAGQILFGPASDRFGRKPTLLVGILVYLLGAVGGIYSSSIDMLYAARILQGIGAACAVVLARAVLRDTHGGAELARAMALAMAIFAIGPLLAPLAGAGLMELGGWRAAFVGQSLVGVALFSTVVLFFRETNAAPNPNALELSNLRVAASRVLSHAQSRHFLLVCVLLQIMVVLLIVTLPRVFKTTFGIEGMAFAFALAASAIGMIVGQLASNRLIARVGVMPTLRGASILLASVAALIWIAGRSGIGSAPLFTGLLMLFNATFLVVFTNSASLVIDPHRDIAGVASALLGFITQMVGNIFALGLMAWVDGAMSTWTNVHVLLVMMATVAVWRYRPRLDVSRGASHG